MSNIVNDLWYHGMSQRVMAKICDVSVKDIKIARKDSSILDADRLEKMGRLKRHFDLFEESNQSPVIDPVTFFEEQIYLCTDKDENPCWAYVYELWMNDLMDDALLTADSWSIQKFYGMDELLEDYPMEFRVVDMDDGMKAIVADIPLPKADLMNMYPLV